MDKNRWKFFVDILMFVDFLALATSGFILWLVLPRGSGASGANFLLLREQWLRMHDFTSVILVALLLIHLILNWVWIQAMFRNVFKIKHNNI